MEKGKVLRLCTPAFRTASVGLRAVADELETMEAAGTVCEVAMVVKGTALDVYALGAADASDAHLLLATGQRKLENALIDHYKEG